MSLGLRQGSIWYGSGVGGNSGSAGGALGGASPSATPASHVLGAVIGKVASGLRSQGSSSDPLGAGIGGEKKGRGSRYPVRRLGSAVGSFDGASGGGGGGYASGQWASTGSGGGVNGGLRRLTRSESGSASSVSMTGFGPSGFGSSIAKPEPQSIPSHTAPPSIERTAFLRSVVRHFYWSFLFLSFTTYPFSHDMELVSFDAFRGL